MKKTYINPEMLVVPFIATHVIANSIVSGRNEGVSDISISNTEFTGVADTKGASSTNLWDNEW